MLGKLRLKNFKRNNIAKNPSEAGVYLFFNKEKRAHYIGKSVNLKNRTLSYLSKSADAKTSQMVFETAYFATISVFSEVEALILEAELIRKFNPKYNIALKDDKSPLYIKITKEEYPRVLSARKRQLNNSFYFFGPFRSRHDTLFLLKILRNIFPFSTHMPDKRACLYSQMGLCKPCPSLIVSQKGSKKASLKKDYLRNIKLLKNFLSGNSLMLQKKLTTEMKYYSNLENFEKAKDISDMLFKINNLKSEVRSGYISDPERKKKEIKTALMLLKIELSKRHFLGRSLFPISQIKRLECFDVAHLSGVFPTASMVVFINGYPEKKYYRHFKIKSTTVINDSLSLSEVVKRRVKHFHDWGKPDVVVVDGGKQQTSMVQRVLMEYKIPTVGFAKMSDTLVIPQSLASNEKFLYLGIPISKSGFGNLLTHLKDEAHRFARRLHHKRLLSSLLH